LSQLQMPAASSRLWYYRGRLQGRLYAAAQTLGDVVDDCRGAGNFGPACASLEPCLGCSASAVLGLETASGCMPRHRHGRSTPTISGIGGWEWSDHTQSGAPAVPMMAIGSIGARDRDGPQGSVLDWPCCSSSNGGTMPTVGCSSTRRIGLKWIIS